VCPTHKHTDLATYEVCSDRPHLMYCLQAMRPDKINILHVQIKFSVFRLKAECVRQILKQTRKHRQSQHTAVAARVTSKRVIVTVFVTV